MAVRTTLTGPFPRSEQLVQATRDHDRGRIDSAALEETFVRAESDVVQLEKRLGTDRLTAGYLRWPDLFRPIAEGWSGFSVGPLTRWFETNTFFRQPILNSPPERSPGALVPRLPPSLRSEGPGRGLILLPGPYTLTGLLDNRSGETSEALVHRLGRLLAEEVRELRSLGFTTFEWIEPLLVYRPPTPTLGESLIAAYQAIHGAFPDATSLLWTYFGDAAPLLPLLRRLPVSVIGFDLSETDPKGIAGPLNGRGLGLGVVDPRTTLSEDPGHIIAIVRDLQERLAPSSIWLGPGAPLDLLAAESAAKKLHVLAAARDALSAGRRPS